MGKSLLHKEKTQKRNHLVTSSLAYHYSERNASGGCNIFCPAKSSSSGLLIFSLEPLKRNNSYTQINAYLRLKTKTKTYANGCATTDGEVFFQDLNHYNGVRVNNF